MANAYTVLDFESFYASKQGYTLRKMTPVEYILDPRFECIGCAILQGDDGAVMWKSDDDLKAFFRAERQRQRAGEKLVYVSHNALFDMCLLVWRFGLVPDLMIDTMGMSRALLYPLIGYVSLAKVSEYLGIGVKGNTIMRVDGMTGQDIRAAGLWQAYTEYAKTDAVLCREIFVMLRTKFPRDEFIINDLVIRCAVKPKFVLDRDVLAQHLAATKQAKLDLLNKAGLTPDEYGKCPELMSNVKFREMLESLGVEIPMKKSPTTGKMTEAFSKADQGMADLEVDDDPMVQALVAARLGVKSTLEESRTQRFIDISQLHWPHLNAAPGYMPMPLRYAGAHTHRLSGDWKLNVQNLPRGGRLRDALVAPPGFVVVTCDASQIEARLVAWLAAIIRAEASELVEAFARGDDVYSLFASKHIYHRLITKADKKERFVGKQAILGLGYGMGYVRYSVQVRKDSRLQLKIEIILTEEESRAIVNGYRHGMAPAVPKAWKLLTSKLPDLASMDSGFQFGPMTFRNQQIIGPTGLPLFYPDLRQEVTDEGKMEWRFKSGRVTKRLFGGKLYENIVQHLARCCNMETALKVHKVYGRHAELASQAHDELIYVVPGHVTEEQVNGKTVTVAHGFAAEFKQHLEALMCERPAWGPDLPLAAESGIGGSYGDAK